MSTLDMFPDLPRRLTHEEIIAGFAELLRAVEAMEFWQPYCETTPPQNKNKNC